MVNQVKDDHQANHVAERIGGCAYKFLGIRPNVLGSLLHDELVEKTNTERQPLVISHPTSDNAIRLRDIAGALDARYAGRRAKSAVLTEG